MFVFITDQNPLSRAHLFDVDFELTCAKEQSKFYKSRLRSNY